MAKTIHGVFLHGVGEQEAGYSTKSQKLLAGALKKQGVDFYGQEVLWAPVLDSLEQGMLRDVKKHGSSNRPLQHLVIETLADALCYRNRQDVIFDLIDQAVLKTRADEVHVFAHSLGVLLALEWMRSRSAANIGKFVSYGANLQLFGLGGPYICPAQVAASGKWTNLYDAQDMLGWPLRGWIPHVRDVEVSVGRWWQWGGLAHIGYFGDKRMWSKTVPAILLNGD